MATDLYKDKYHSLIEEFESKEKFWGELDQRLRRTLSHLLIIAQGPTNSKINTHLGVIKTQLKKGAKLEEIEDEVAKLREVVMAEAKTDDQGEVPPVNEIIIRILQRIPLPKDMMGRVAEIIKQIEPGLPPRMIPWAINNVGNLILEVRSRMEDEKSELENLLSEITEKITEMGSHVGIASDYAIEGIASAKSLSEKVTAQVAAIKDSADHATDLTTFRTALGGALAAIQSHIDAKMEDDKRREESLKKEVATLRGHVVNLQKELVNHQEQLKKATEESHKDALTGALNRMAFEKRMGEEISRTSRFASTFSIVLLDLDKFKTINDTFGHIAGDQVLKAVSMIAASQLRDVDAFCRYGGEEFVAILPETDQKGAMNVAEKVRKAVENFRFHSRGQRVVITMSAGVAQFNPVESQENLIDRADKALYRAKQEGRNRTVPAK